MKLGNGFIEYRKELKRYFQEHYPHIVLKMSEIEVGEWILRSPFGLTIEQEAELLADELFENDNKK